MATVAVAAGFGGAAEVGVRVRVAVAVGAEGVGVGGTGVGVGGKGDGTVPVGTKINGWVPSLLTPKAMAYSDGYLYSMVRHGRGLMPAYGDKIRGTDRWSVVNYVRVLQQQQAGAKR